MNQAQTTYSEDSHEEKCYTCLVMENIRGYFLDKEREYINNEGNPFNQEDFNELERVIVNAHKIKHKRKE